MQFHVKINFLLLIDAGSVEMLWKMFQMEFGARSWTQYACGLIGL